MSLSLHDDHLPASFFARLYPEFTDPAGATDAPASPAQVPSERLARLVEQWPGAVWVFDAQLRCQAANREARHWHAPAPGAADEPPPSSAFHELLDTAMQQALLPYVAAALRGMEHRFEAEFHHPSHGARWLAVRVQPDHDREQVAGVFLHLQDITEQRLSAQEALNHSRHLQDQVARHAAQLDESETRFRMMNEGLRDSAIFFLDPLGRVSHWTASAERLLGHTGSRIVGAGVDRFDAPEQAADTAAALERAALLGQCEATGWRVRGDGSRFWAHTVYTALHDETSGEARGYSCLMRDMTEVKRLEDLLRQLNQELEDRVRERTQQLQAINQDLEAFSYSVSHDLRAPLRHIGSFVELLREDLGPNVPPEALRHIGTIAQSAEHMGQLIEGLLAFSRLGRAPLARREVAMGGLLHSSLNRVQHDPALRREDGAVRWQLAPDLPSVQGDGLLLSQVWDNLLANALKYSRPREVAEIGVGWTPGEDGQPVFWVRDNGVGFDPRRADRLFGVFQRLHRASEFEGTGIGLALCRRIVERHGGRIWADSSPGQGSTFSFTLPAHP